jgi:hypothetical protein
MPIAITAIPAQTSSPLSLPNQAAFAHSHFFDAAITEVRNKMQCHV